MRRCASCGGSVEASFRYCPWCAAPQRRKLTDFFRAHRLIEGDRNKALRVSGYLGGPMEERHVRCTVWDESGELVRAQAAVSLDETEAARLARFLVDPEAPAASTVDASTTALS